MTERIAISLPGEMLERVEAERRRSGESRSAVIRRLIEVGLERDRLREGVVAYVEGYRRVPETEEEVAAAEHAAAELLAGEPWE